jgi:hypothetical protein
MRDLPKFVVGRLRSSAPVAGHPGADVLTAFGERSLPASERAVVLEHLARCDDCREIIALALPATEVAKPTVATLSFRSRWRWPVLRAVAVAASIIAVAALGIYQYHRKPANLTVARNAENVPAVVPPATQETVPAPTRSNTVVPNKESRREAAPRQSGGVVPKPPSSTADAMGWRAKSVATAPASGIVSGAATSQGTKVAMAAPPRDLSFAAPQASPAQTMKQIPAPSPASRDISHDVSQLGEAHSEVVTVEAQTPPQPQANLTADLRAPAESKDNVSRAKPAASVAGAPVGGPHLVARNPAAIPPTVTPHWTISSTGGLRRSFDGGKTWQDVNVYAKLRAFADSTEMVSTSNSGEPAKKFSKTKTTTAASEPPILFRSVAAIDNQVWAGASGGLLYHSADAGSSWTSVTPSAHGSTLSGDIIHIEFSDALHGSVATSTAEVWVTGDGGQSWQKQ